MSSAGPGRACPNRRCHVGGCGRGRCGDETERAPPRPSIPRCDHQPGAPLAFPLPAEPVRHQGAAIRARRDRQLRNDPPVVRQIRCGPRAAGQGCATTAGPHRASGPDVGESAWRALAAVAGGRRTRCRAGCPAAKRRDKAAAKRFFQRVLCSFPAPREIVTGPLRSYPAAKAGIPALATVRQVFVKAAARVNDRAENSHQRIRKRERRMRGFRDPKRARAFLTSFGPIRSRAEHSHRPARVREKAMRRFKSAVQIGGSTAAIRLGACRGVQPCRGLPLSSRCET